MKKAKKFVKYLLNTLTIINALLVGLAPIWGIPMADKIISSISVIMATISTYLLSSKAVSKAKGE